MENASKALIMAGAVLIAIIILSLGILVFNKFGRSAKNMANMDEQEISAFNSKITPYIGKSVSATQVNALLQYCLSSNISVQNTSENYKIIKITVNTLTPNDPFEYNNGKYTGVKRVNTGSGEFYNVMARANTDGFMTDITINHN